MSNILNILYIKDLKYHNLFMEIFYPLSLLTFKNVNDDLSNLEQS